METITNLLEIEILNIGKYSIKLFMIANVLLIIVFTKILLWLIRKALFRRQKRNNLDKGNTYALFQIIKYIIWVASIAFVLETVGVKITVLLAGSAALLVGIGLGLQQTFNDFISGIILLSERSIKVGDILEIDGEVIKIQEIGLRTSKGINRDEISFIIPNSSITTNKVINWSHQTKETRFKIDVGVAYGSDVDLVIKVLEESAFEHKEIYNKKLIEVRFLDFSNSSLNFQLLFFSENIFGIEKVKSDIRKIINRKFIENQITIPFPQIDLHLKSNEANLGK